ncbi:MAG: pyridoxine 5'-phosphate synthase [Deltaproteobacteria bacterium]|nr:pyridoxine 5'-phosphate synthase [Deltaproteobacteria bacterium]
MAKLSVNVNKIATLRNARGGQEPNLIHFVRKIVKLGADGITVHPRADQRHITPDDARMVVREVKAAETNFEGDIREEFVALVLECHPTQCTLVPVKPGELTSNHGWEVKKWAFLLEPVIKRLKTEGIRVSLFVEAGDEQSVKVAGEIGADRIEIYTEPYARAFNLGHVEPELGAVILSAQQAHKVGLGVNAGHDLTHENLPLLVQEMENLEEVSIGHHLICHALEVGIEQAVKDYIAAAQVI